MNWVIYWQHSITQPSRIVVSLKTHTGCIWCYFLIDLRWLRDRMLLVYSNLRRRPMRKQHRIHLMSGRNDTTILEGCVIEGCVHSFPDSLPLRPWPWTSLLLTPLFNIFVRIFLFCFLICTDDDDDDGVLETPKQLCIAHTVTQFVLYITLFVTF